MAIATIEDGQATDQAEAQIAALGVLAVETGFYLNQRTRQTARRTGTRSAGGFQGVQRRRSDTVSLLHPGPYGSRSKAGAAYAHSHLAPDAINHLKA